MKARKISRNSRHLDRNLKARAAARNREGAATSLRVHFDEFETFEGRRSTGPLSIAVAIESTTRFHFAAIAASIRPRREMAHGRRAAIASEERRLGARRDRSRAACRLALRRATATWPLARQALLHTGKKSTYPALASRAFAGRAFVHARTLSVLPRDVKNPLFPINNEEACLRERISRLRRESWLVTKDRTYLNLHLALYAAWRNWVRPRFNYDKKSPGQIVGHAPRRLRTEELIGWRQDWGPMSICPFGLA